VNGFTSPVDIVVDGKTVSAAVGAGAVVVAGVDAGSHSLVLRPTQGAASPALTIKTTAGATNTFAAVLSNGAVATAALDDTNAVVPAGATKVRVLHLAPNAGTIQVYRTQPDFPSPVQWQFPFNYNPNPTSAAEPFVQSTVGTWEIRVWRTPADSSGWANAPIKVQISLASGEKKTIAVLDAPGGIGYTTF
jgi:hypothetical protein